MTKLLQQRDFESLLHAISYTNCGFVIIPKAVCSSDRLCLV